MAKSNDAIHITLAVLKTRVVITSAWRWVPSKKVKNELVIKDLTKAEKKKLVAQIGALKNELVIKD